MTESIIYLKCKVCNNHICDINIDHDVSLLTPHRFIVLLLYNKITFTCPLCSCSHEFEENDHCQHEQIQHTKVAELAQEPLVEPTEPKEHEYE